MDKQKILKQSFKQLIDKYSFLPEYFENNNISYKDNLGNTLNNYFDNLNQEEQQIDKNNFVIQLFEYIKQMQEFLGESQNRIDKLTIIAGQDKSGNKEKFNKIDINSGDIISIVGPTGSGKSRLLADIEWVAQKDTPTKRQILLNDEIPDKKWRFSPSEKLVAQLSQNMNFVMDLTVFEFLELHSESRLIENKTEIIKQIIEQANCLAGEKFKQTTPITSLSGGQSRALMIADTAILSKSPIVLIDEIENAGIDRKQALNLLLTQDKIVLIATHDPVLALMAQKRINISNGGIEKIIKTDKSELKILEKLEKYDKEIQELRNKLRYGKKLI